MAKEDLILFHSRQKERGSVTVVALLILVILTLIGVSSINSSKVELQIATNDQLHRIAFNNTESGIYGSAKLVSLTMSAMSEQPVGTDPDSVAAGVDYLPDDGSYVADTFFGQIAGFDAYDGGTHDLTYKKGGIPVEVDLQRLREMNLAGGATEFASGFQGVGAGSAGGVAIFYRIDADGTGPRLSSASLSAEYRKVVGVAGGL